MKKTICGIILVLLMANYSYAYSDIDNNHWAYNDINVLTEKGIISGYPDNSFKPENNITRAEFITILMKVLEPDADVSSITGYWAEGSIALAKAKDILRLEDYNEFNPDKSITRREICLMIYRSIKEFSNISIENINNKISFCDIDQSNEEEVKISLILSHLGILSGYPDKTVRFDSFSTRGELCAFINNFIKSKLNIITMINDSEAVFYENGFASITNLELPQNLKKWQYTKDIPYATTKINEINMFSFNEPPEKYKDIFKQFEREDNKYLQYRKKFGENKYVIAIQFSTTNNTKNSEIYGGHEFLHISFPEEEISIVDAFDTSEIIRQLNKNANVGEVVKPGETLDTSAFYVVDRLPEIKIMLDRSITGLYNLDIKQYEKVTSFHSLVINLESR